MVKIVWAEEKHIPQIVKLWEEFMDFHKDIDPRFPMRKDAPLIWEKHLATLMKSEDTHVLVALDGGRAVGFSVSMIGKYPPVFQREIYGLLSEIAVTANQRRKSVGEQLFEKNLEWFKSKDIDRVELSVAAANAIGYPFWRKHGFRDYLHRLHREI